MTASGHRSSRWDGFTLLEMLVSIAILGLILVALTSGVRFAGNAWVLQQKRRARQGDADAVQHVLRQMLQSASGIRGSDRALAFTGKLPAALARGGLFDIALNGSGNRLTLSWHAHSKVAPPDQGEAELLNGITDFQLSYFRPPDGWQPAAKAKTPPALVRITLRLPGGQQWPALVIAPKVEDTAPASPDHRNVTQDR
jgi:prepilin-type N-terminal cleavage/methylation domain-containing protein